MTPRDEKDTYSFLNMLAADWCKAMFGDMFGVVSQYPAMKLRGWRGSGSAR
jgi:hypothetical protein